MRAIFGLVLIAGMGLAGFAVYMVKGYMSDQNAALAAERARASQVIKTELVYAVNKPVAYGERITPDMLVQVAVGQAHVPEGVFRTEDEIFTQGTDVPRMAVRAMEKFEPILAIKVTEPGQVAGITTSLQAGMSAFTINVDASSGVSGLLRPGDRVNVYWTGILPTSNRRITRLIDTGVQLIAVDQSTDPNRVGTEVARTVTVQVSPQDVAELQQAQTSGKLSLALVGTNDDTIASVIEVDQRSLLGIELEEPKVEQEVAEAPEVCSIRQRRGAEVVVTPIPCTN